MRIRSVSLMLSLCDLNEKTKYGPLALFFFSFFGLKRKIGHGDLMETQKKGYIPISAHFSETSQMIRLWGPQMIAKMKQKGKRKKERRNCLHLLTSSKAEVGGGAEKQSAHRDFK